MTRSDWEFLKQAGAPFAHKAREAFETLTHEEQVVEVLKAIALEMVEGAKTIHSTIHLYGLCMLALLGLILWRVW